MFWGLFFIGIGVVVLVNVFFGISIPIFKTLIGLFLVYMGLKIIFGGLGFRIDKKIATSTEVVFSKSNFQAGRDKETFSTVFGESHLDLTAVKREDLPKKMKFDVVFGSHQLMVPKDLPIVVETSTVFGKVILPDNNRTVLGNFVYRSPGLSDTDKPLTLVVNVVFGRFDLILKD